MQVHPQATTYRMQQADTVQQIRVIQPAPVRLVTIRQIPAVQLVTMLQIPAAMGHPIPIMQPITVQGLLPAVIVIRNLLFRAAMQIIVGHLQPVIPHSLVIREMLPTTNLHSRDIVM